MAFASTGELRDRIEALCGRRIAGEIPVFDDTSNMMAIRYGSVLRLEGRDYFVLGEATEGRFGIDDQPKFWVKFVVDLDDGSRKLAKLEFEETFTTAIGRLTVRCRRNPDKESRVLAAVAGDTRFMQGRTVRDRAGLNVRILEFIRGETLFERIGGIEEPHEVYYRQRLPEILRQALEAIEALADLHAKGLHHGDVRNDHILVDAVTGTYRWIDFDLEVDPMEYDVWSIGNVLTYLVAKDIVTCREAEAAQQAAAPGAPPITAVDAMLFYGHRLANLRKVLPHVSRDLNDLLMRFSAAAVDGYERAADVARDLAEILDRGRL